MRYIIILIFITFCYQSSVSQVSMPVFGEQSFVNGFDRPIEGESIQYFSVYPDFAKEALLTRCTDGKKSVEWETAAIPADIKGPYIYFIWIAAHSTGTNSGTRNFDLFVNDEFILTFTTYPKSYPDFWSFKGRDSTELVFELHTQDVYHDAHGLAYLRVPSAKYQKGSRLKIKVTGQNQNSNDWYMTFKFPLDERLNVTPLPFLINNPPNSPLKRPILFTVLHFGTEKELKITINNITSQSYVVRNGMNKFELPVDATTDKSSIHIHASLAGIKTLDTIISTDPVTYRELYFIHHSHNDIGYSNLQEEVEKIQNENIRSALKMIDKTRNYPDGSKFVWNIESLWAVENFLSVAGNEKKIKFITAVRNRQICLSAFYANILTGLCTEGEMDWITAYASLLREKFDFPIKSAMFSDIPGISWTITGSLAKNKIRYLLSGPNFIENLPDKGDRIGSTLKYLGDKAFWWTSSSGKDSILLWTCGKGYSSWHRFRPGEINEHGENKIASYLEELDSIHCPYKIIPWLYSIVSDNGPVDSTICDFVRSWNEKYLSPKIFISGATGMFEKFEKEYGKSLPVLHGDFTPYWEDGAYSTAFEEGENRVLSAKILQLENLAQQENIVIGKNLLYRAKRDIIMFHEHTWGSWCSISDPGSPFTLKQWEYKKHFIDSAKFYVDSIEKSLVKCSVNPSQIRVFNTLTHSYSGYVEFDRPDNYHGNTLKDEKGYKIPVQKLSNGRLCFIADNVPPGGSKYYSLSGEYSDYKPFHSDISYKFDNTTGAIKSLRVHGLEFVKSDIFHGILQAIYVIGLDPDSFYVTSLNKSEIIEDGPVIKKLKISCYLEGTNEVDYEITEFNGLDYLELSCIIDKKAITSKESVHIAFPFLIIKPVVRVGIDSTFISPEKGQIPAANRDFYSVQHWIDISNDNTGVAISCPRGTLFEIGRMNDERPLNHGYKKWRENSLSSSTIFLYAMNNYWNTNFKASQESHARFDFFLKFHKSFDLNSINNFGNAIYQPLMFELR